MLADDRQKVCQITDEQCQPTKLHQMMTAIVGRQWRGVAWSLQVNKWSDLQFVTVSDALDQFL